MLLRWRGPALVGLIDQTVISGAHLALNVVLARWLTPAEYGGFAVGYSALLLVAGPHTSLLVDPLAVVGPRRIADQGVRYFRALLILHVIFAVGLSLLTVVSPYAAGRNLPVSWVAGFSVAVAMVLGLWLLRSVSYFAMRSRTALAGSLCYATLLLALIAAARIESALNVPIAFVLMGASAIGASFWVAASLGVFAAPHGHLELMPVVREHWRYGKWILAASVANGIANGLYAPLLAAAIGLDQAALMRAVQNLVLPLQQAVIGIGMVALPSMSRRAAVTGPASIVRIAPTFVAAGVTVAVIYGVAVSLLAAPLLSIAYSDQVYANRADLVWPAAIATVAGVAAQLLGILVRAVDRPHGILFGKLAALAWFAVPGVLLVRAFGVPGAFWSLTAGGLIEAFALFAALIPLRTHRDQAVAAGTT